ncbi:sensor histidine kinase [Shouchella sp. JSM 1781072]|uniref:sensor histidine kinase n=1 Tax=Shouchella sp. JSM 1781072 TaxID=3344581 RepID=UPI0035C16FF6
MNALSIKKKVWMGIGVTVLAVILLSSMLIFFLYERLYVDQQIEQFEREGQALAAFYDQEGLSDEFYSFLEWSQQTSDAVYVVTEDPMELAGGAPFEDEYSEEMISFEERQILLQGESVYVRRDHPRFQQEIIGVAIPFTGEGNRLEGIVFISQPLTDLYELFSNVLWWVILIVALAGGVILFMGSRLTKQLVGPLLKMKLVAEKMESGDFSERITLKRSEDEFMQLAESINQLADSLEQVESNRRVFLANVAHELRTPLSYMIGYMEGIEEEVIETKKGMIILTQEAQRLNRLVNDLLDLAQLEGDKDSFDKQPIVYAELIREASETVQVIANQKQMPIKLDLNEESIIIADRDRMKQVLINLLTNAVAYSDSGNPIYVTLQSVDGKAEVEIKDYGYGIPKKDIARVTERFFRVKRGRSRSDGGTGLGLSIVQEIVAKHEGTFHLHSVEEKGTKAIIVLNEYD